RDGDAPAGAGRRRRIGVGGKIRECGRRGAHSRRLSGLGELERVADQVLKKLPQLRGVAVQSRKLPDVQAAAGLLQPLFEDGNHLTNDGIEIDRLELLAVGADAAESEQILD